MEPPPVFQASFFQESPPGSPGSATVLNFQASLPVLASKAAMKPRMPYSPPAMPMMTLSFTISGACMRE